MIFTIASAWLVGFVHALAPDHWLPFAAMARANSWSRRRLTGAMLCAGFLHLFAAFALTFLAFRMGFSPEHLRDWDARRAGVLPILLVGFGMAYFIWAIKKKTRRKLSPAPKGSSGFLKVLFFLVIFGPCEPLVPLLFASAVHGWESILISTAAFSTATLTTMVIVAQASYAIPKAQAEKRSHRLSHVVAGGLMAAAGLAIGVFGI